MLALEGSASQSMEQPAAADGEKPRPGMEGGATLVLPPAGTCHSSSANSALLLRRRRRLKRNLSANPLGTAAPSTLGPGTRSLDRKTLLKYRQWVQLQPQEREWVRGELRRGCLQIYERRASPGLRPLLCTLDTTAGEVAARLLRPGGGSSAVLRVLGQAAGTGDERPEVFSASGTWVGRPDCWDPEEVNGVHPEDAVCQGLELFHCGAASSSSSSVEELSAEPPPAVTVRPLSHVHGSLYVQLHGDSGRRLEPHEKPLLLQNDYLFQLGFRDLCRVQEEGMEPEIGCLIRFYAGKPNGAGMSDRTQLSGTYNVRKGKMQLPVNRWTRRQVILCGTCLIVSSVKESQAGKMHVLPLIGGKVEEVKKHQHCLAFSSSGPQSQTYYICFDTFTDYLRWLRQGSKIASQRISSVDLSCCNLEHLPENLFYSQDLTHLNLKQNALRLNPDPAIEGTLDDLHRFSKLKSLNLSNNNLGDFPSAVCDIPTLMELNLSCNGLRVIPPAVGEMKNLQTFLLDGNYLQTLPAELGSLSQLGYLGLSFNEFTEIPEVLEKMAAMDKLCMPGNSLHVVDLKALRRMPQVKHVDLRLNEIKSLLVDDVDFLLHVTQLDLRDNKMTDLDVTSLSNLEVLHCERNHLASLKMSGYYLKALYTSSNALTSLAIYPDPCNLAFMDISRNCLECLPDWVCESKNLEVLDVGHNCLTELPARIFCARGLRKLLAGYNRLNRLPECVERTQLEILDVQHNQLLELPTNLLLKSER